MPRKPEPVGLRIELEHVKPLVWRRIVVSDQWTLASLHNYLQWVVGWQDSHAHEFHVGSRVVAPQWWIREMEFDRDAAHCMDERRVSVAAVASEVGVGGVFEYHYDMGDGWEHRIVIETPPSAWMDDELPLPACTAGENACPPEDVGGPHGYQHLLASIADPACEKHVDMRRWAGGVFDPTGFDLNRLNRTRAAGNEQPASADVARDPEAGIEWTSVAFLGLVGVRGFVSYMRVLVKPHA